MSLSSYTKPKACAWITDMSVSALAFWCRSGVCFWMEHPCHPLLAAQDWCQHKPDCSQMKLKWKVASRDILAVLQQRVVIAWGQSRENPQEECIVWSWIFSSIFFTLQTCFFETTCFYGCSLYMPGAPEILQFNSSIESSSQYVFLEAFRGTYSILESEVITVGESVALDLYSRDAREVPRGAGSHSGVTILNTQSIPVVLINFMGCYYSEWQACKGSWSSDV